MRLIRRTLSIMPSSLMFTAEGSHPSLTETHLNTGGIIRGAEQAGFEAYFSQRKLMIFQGNSQQPEAFFETCSKLIVRKDLGHEDGDIRFVDMTSPTGGTHGYPLTDFVQLRVWLSYHDYWKINVDGWRDDLWPVLDTGRAHKALHNAGYYVENMQFDLTMFASGIQGRYGDDRRNFLQAEAEKLARIVKPALRVRYRGSCGVRYILNR